MKLRDTVKRLVGHRGRLLIRRLHTRQLGFVKEYRAAVQGMRALEIGGPTGMFLSGGEFPIYSCLASIDNCNFALDTIWSGNAVPYQRSFISEATALDVESDTYDCLLASHCLEHIANPVKALLEWKRVLRPNGLMLLILPNRDFTFDWRRPVTPLEHMSRDYELSTPESDRTHLEEVLSLHDLSRDPGAGTPENFRQRCVENLKFRAIHHHVFSPHTAIEIVRHAGFGIVRQDVRQIHIFTFARKDLGC